MSHLSSTFSALGDATRFAIVERLLNEGELCAGQLLDVSPMSAPAISRHLKVLHSAGIVNKRIDKQRRMYSVNPQAVYSINEWAQKFKQFWEVSFDRLAATMQTEMDNE